MDALHRIRTNLTKGLWLHYCTHVKEAALVKEKIETLKAPLILDHYAIIDLPSQTTGLEVLREIFSSLGYEVRGKDPLPEK